MTCTWPSLWETAEVHSALDKLADALEESEATEDDPEQAPDQLAAVNDPFDRFTVDEYYAWRVTQLVQNFDGIAAANHEKPKRRVDDDATVMEAPVFRDGGEADPRGGRPDGSCR